MHVWPVCSHQASHIPSQQLIPCSTSQQNLRTLSSRDRLTYSCIRFHLFVSYNLDIFGIIIAFLHQSLDFMGTWDPHVIGFQDNSNCLPSEKPFHPERWHDITVFHFP